MVHGRDALGVQRLHDQAGDQARGGEQEGALHEGQAAQDGRPPPQGQIQKQSEQPEKPGRIVMFL